MKMYDVHEGNYYTVDMPEIDTPVVVKVIKKNDTRFVTARAGRLVFKIEAKLLREPTSTEMYEILVANGTELAKAVGKELLDLVRSVAKGACELVKDFVHAFVKTAHTLNCALGNHSVFWELEPRYDGTGHEYYYAGYCEHCNKEFTKDVTHHE